MYLVFMTGTGVLLMQSLVRTLTPVHRRCGTVSKAEVLKAELDKELQLSNDTVADLKNIHNTVIGFSHASWLATRALHPQRLFQRRLLCVSFTRARPILWLLLYLIYPLARIVLTPLSMLAALISLILSLFRCTICALSLQAVAEARAESSMSD